MLLICPVRPGDSNEELRYAIRSWEKNLILPGGLRLWTVGHQPSWLVPDLHIDGNRYASSPLAVFDNVHLGARAAAEYGADEVVFMNDDFFCLDPVGAILPVRRDLTLAEHVGLFPVNASAWWPASLRLTADWLASEGFPHPDSYEVHRPLLACPAAMSGALDRWVAHAGGSLGDVVPQWRTVYGTLAKVDAYPVADGKLSRTQTGYGTPWVSTSDQSWIRYSRHLMRRFQKPSRWER